MLYTLLKFLGWGLLLAFLGGCIGWALRALKCRGELARASATTVDADDVERMRNRLANLEQVVAERDRLRMQVADMRHADSPGVVGAATIVEDPSAELDTDDPDTDDTDDPPAATDPGTDEAETDAGDVAAPVEGFVDPGEPADSGIGPGDGIPDEDEIPDEPADSGIGPGDEIPSESVDDVPPSITPLDAAEASAILGKSIVLDDLAAIEGIGPKISELCRGIGIETWRQLADTDLATLRSMLDDAGSRFQVHDPGTWSQQAGLLADGRWADFKQLTDDVDGGR